jgi:3-(3-hydroxy-phenyl)propionate hydroxylase
MENATQVLIVGAGPVGLLCAFALAAADIKVTIVDAAGEPKIGGRAVVIHASTLDVSGNM